MTLAQLDRITSRLEPEIASAFVAAVKSVTLDNRIIRRVGRLLRRGSDTAALTLLADYANGAIAPSLFARLSNALASASLAGARYAELPRYALARVHRTIETVARQQTGRLIRGLGDGQKSAFRRILARRVRQAHLGRGTGLEVDSIARDVLRLGTGLDRQRAGMLARRIGTGSAKALRRYRDRLLVDRARTIARTESLRAANWGELEYWKRAKRAGAIDPRLVKRWILTPDERLCRLCASLDGVVTEIDEPWPWGGFAPPRHPRCRCTQALRRMDRPTAPQTAGGPPVQRPPRITASQR